MHQDNFKVSLLGCSENVSNTAPTIVYTMNVSIDCNVNKQSLGKIRKSQENCRSLDSEDQDKRRTGVFQHGQYTE